MRKTKVLVSLLLITMLLVFVPNISRATVEATRDVYSNNGSMKFNFTGLTLDLSHEYEFGLTRTQGAEVETWHLITEYTESTATVDITTTTDDLREVMNVTDTGYITIRDKNTSTVVVEPYKVDLQLPFLKVTNLTVIPNEKEFDTLNDNTIQMEIRNTTNCTPYYQYEKITDQDVIDKYKEIKANNGNYMELQSMLKTTPPTDNWVEWNYWNGHSLNGTGGFGYTESPVSVPDSGLYYMWLYFSGNNVKNIYGYILVDNLQPDIALEGISLVDTATIEVGETLTLTPGFSPSNATNKIVTWSSSDESVATVNNSGKVTALKASSTIITVTSQDGNRTATCTVTVTEPTEDNNNDNNNNDNNDNDNNQNPTDNNEDDKDQTVAPGKLPATGTSTTVVFVIAIALASSVFAYIKYRKLRIVK